MVALHDHGLLDGFEIVFDDGYSVVASINHKFLTSEGMLPLHVIISQKIPILAQEMDNSLRGCISSENGEDDSLSFSNAGRVADMAYSDAPLSSTRGLVCRKIVRVTPVGVRRMYDLEVSHSKHNFQLPNGVITSNSHAISYSIVGYVCAFLKYHHPLEWWTAVLNNASRNDVNDKFWKYCGKYVDAPDIATSASKFVIVGSRIKAPLSLLERVGPVMHDQLVRYAPYSDIKDFCQKMYRHTQTLVVDPVSKVVKKGRNIPRNHMYRLIVSGFMDSLFAPDDTDMDKFIKYEKCFADASGKKVKPIISGFLNLPRLVLYQIKKSVLPSYRGGLFDMVSDLNLPILTRDGNGALQASFERPFFNGKVTETIERKYYFLKPEIVKFLLENRDDLVPPEHRNKHFCVPAYVISDTRRLYHTTKEMAILVLDLDGERIELIKWPASKGKLPDNFKDDLAGSVVLALLNEKDGVLSLDDIISVAVPLSKRAEILNNEAEE
ncbi:MAG: hypothetical protein NVS9B9_23600 [Ktedonobacteraceae bacterium]